MLKDAIPGPWPPLSAETHLGRAACQQLVGDVLRALAPTEGGGLAPPPPSLRQITCIDHHFADWPLSEDTVTTALAGWLRQGGRQLRIVGVDFDTTARAHARFVRWRRDWSHAIEVLQAEDPLLPPPVRGLLIGGAFLQWLDAPDWRLRVLTDAVHVRAIDGQIADFLQRCEPGWPATTLGL